MSFNAIVRFTGLCAFVPHTNGMSMRCLFVNARLGGGLVFLPEHAHTPVVVFDVRDLEPPGQLPRPLFEVIGDFTGVWILNQDDIALIPMGGQNPFVFPDSDVGEEPTQANLESLAWVPHMRLVSTGAGPVRGDCLGGNSPELRKRVAARLRVSHGRARTSRHTKDGQVYLKWDFKANEGGTVHRTQTLAEEIELRLNGLDELILEAKKFDEDNPSRQLRLKNKSGTPSLAIDFKNIELDQLQGQARSYPPRFDDFVYFYDLSADINAERNIPHLRPSPPPAVSRPICPGAVFDPHGDV